MKNLFRTFLIFGILLLLGIVFTLWSLQSPVSVPDVSLIKENIGISTSEVTLNSGSGETLLFPTRENNNEKIEVRNFKNDPGVTAWGDNSTLVLGDGLIDEDPAFQIFYYDLDQSFNIAILQEPIAEVRKVAETQLLKRLQISTEDACSLLIVVATPGFVSEDLSGKNLGLSFCPGSMQL